MFTFYTIIAVLDTTYGARLPESFTQWLDVFRVVELDLSGILLPQACIQWVGVGSGFLSNLIINCGSPLVLVMLCFFFIVGKRLARSRSSACNVIAKGLMDSLPLALLVSFCFVASTSAKAFQASSCVAYKYDADTYHSFLRADLSVRCSDADHTSKDHEAIKAIAWVFIGIWPIGTVLLYAALLLLCQSAIMRRTPTQLTRATKFLTRDYTAECYYWEILELVRRTALVGWVLLVPVEQSFFRLFAALLISIVFLIMLLALRPYRRVEDNLIASAAQASCVFVFIGAMLTRLFADISDVTQNGLSRTVSSIMAFRSVDAIAAALVIVTLGVLICILVVMLLLVQKEGRMPTIRTAQTNSAPELSLPQGGKWHCFLSHVWSTAQVKLCHCEVKKEADAAQA